MRNQAHHEHDPGSPFTAPRLKRRLLGGYRRNEVDAWISDASDAHEALAHRLDEALGELAERSAEATELSHDLRRARAELRYWNDRSSYVESEVSRARATATELERAARERAEKVELEAQERALQLVDRVCAEANALLQHAREEARDMFLRYESEVDMSQQKLDRLENARRSVATTMQGALSSFEDAVRELDTVAPSKRIAEMTEPAERRPGRTPGQVAASEAAREFLATSPLPAVLTASVIDADELVAGRFAAAKVPPSLTSKVRSLAGDETAEVLAITKPIT